MEQLKTIKEQIIAEVMGQLGNLKEVNTKELGEAIDMIKDLAEASYYCTIEEAMHKSDEEKDRGSNNYYYTEKYYPYRDMDRQYGRMYYGNEPQSSSENGEDRNYYTERDYPLYLHDEREGRSPMRRRMYMESKDTHQDSTKTMKELETYMQELTQDMMEIIEKASPEEKSIIQKKVNTLATKIQNV